jgi:hypothetical protein
MARQSERTAGLRGRDAGEKVASNGNAGSAPSAEQVAQAKEARATIVKAQNTKYDHSYGHIDMRDDQIIGGGKENALQKYNPGIIISEKGKEMDKKLDEHYE